MSRDNFEALKKQKRLYTVFKAAIGVCTTALLYYAVGDDLLAEKVSMNRSQDIELPSDKTDAHGIWMSRLEAENKLFGERLAFMEKSVLETKKQESRKEKENQRLRQELSKLKQEIGNQGEKLSQQISQKASASKSRNLGSEVSRDPFSSSSQEQTMRRLPLREISMPVSKDTKIKHVDKAIPAGITVKAILVSSTDAPCSVYSSSDPQPVKLRIIDDGHLPKKVRAKLKGGLIIGSAYGNLSSERVNIRVERLTQAKPNGDFIETEIAGYVTGEDGKYGVRGIVVDKSEQFVGNAAFSGFFGGIRDALTPEYICQNCGAKTTQGMFGSWSLSTECRNMGKNACVPVKNPKFKG